MTDRGTRYRYNGYYTNMAYLMREVRESDNELFEMLRMPWTIILARLGKIPDPLDEGDAYERYQANLRK